MIRCSHILLLVILSSASTLAQSAWVPFPIDNTIPITAAELMNGDSVIVGTASGSVMLVDGRGSYDRGMIDAAKSGLPVSFIIRTTPGVLFAGIAPSYVYRSRDEGRSWAPVEALLSTSAMARSADGTLIAVGGLARVSSDDGETWNPLPAFPAPGTAVCSIVGGTGRSFLVGFELNGLFASDDGGAAWRRAGLEGTNPSPVVTGNGRIVAATGVVFDSTRPIALQSSSNGGESWKTILPLPGTPQGDPVVVNAMMMTSTGTILAGLGVGRHTIVQSTDGGDEWRAANEGLRDTVAMLMKSGPDGLAILATSDGGLYRRSYASSVASASSSDPAAILVHPDPLTAGSRITFALRSASDVRITLSDLLQRRSRVIAEERFGPGLHTLPCDPGDLPSGIYLLVVGTPDGDRARKVMIVR